MRILGVLCLAVVTLFARQSPSGNSAAPEPRLPVIDDNACPFEGCTFRKWIVNQNTSLYSTWMDGRKAVSTLQKGQIVTGLTGVHITIQPDRIQVLKPIPDLGFQRGDIILRYMNVGEGFANIWAKGQWHEEYDVTFVAEKDDPDCPDCPAKVTVAGRKEWWAQVKTAQGATGWAKVDDQFDCIDSLSGDERCDKL